MRTALLPRMYPTALMAPWLGELEGAYLAIA